MYHNLEKGFYVWGESSSITEEKMCTSALVEWGKHREKMHLPAVNLDK